MGHVGAVTAGCLAALGHEILAIDTDPLVAAGISAGIAPVREPGLDELFRAAAQSGRLRAASYAEVARIGVDAIMVCVGSPARADGSLDLWLRRPGRGAAEKCFRGERPRLIDIRLSPQWAAAANAYRWCHAPEPLR
jgi:UDP-N-acetyl-D-mannosaminuronate dehydrogenase